MKLSFLEEQFQGEDDDDIDFYRYQHERIEADVDVVKNLGAYGNLTLGTGFRSIEVRNNPNRNIATEALTNPQVFNTNSYLKGKIGISVDTRANKVIPQSGILASGSVEHLEALTDGSQSLTRLSADWAFLSQL